MVDIGGTYLIQLIPVTIPDPAVDDLFPGYEAFEKLEEIREYGKNLGLNLVVHPPKRDESKSIEATNCSVPWQCVYVTVDGFLTPCRFIPLASVVNFGNIFEKHYSDIRNVKEYRKFRHRLANCPDDVPTPCKNCPMLC
jgi:MoaA/NifB/PqqE/SkfB family radical SAM enzyme